MMIFHHHQRDSSLEDSFNLNILILDATLIVKKIILGSFCEEMKREELDNKNYCELFCYSLY